MAAGLGWLTLALILACCSWGTRAQPDACPVTLHLSTKPKAVGTSNKRPFRAGQDVVVALKVRSYTTADIGAAVVLPSGVCVTRAAPRGAQAFPDSGMVQWSPAALPNKKGYTFRIKAHVQTTYPNNTLPVQAFV